MYAHLSKYVNTFVGSIEDAQAWYERIGKPVPYRAEFNPMSSRWLIMKSDNTCQAAGLSESEAKIGVMYHINLEIQRGINQAA